MTDALWYFGRGSGVVSLVLLSVVVALGVAARSGRTPFGLPRFAVSMLHRNVGLTAVVFLSGHVLSLLFDLYAQLRVFDLVVPFVGSHRPLWLGLGTVGLDLLVAIVVTSLLRRRIGVSAWRAVHWLAYLCWPVALLHGLGTGSDRGTWWLWAIAMSGVVLVVAAVGWRLAPDFDRRPRRRVAARLLVSPVPAVSPGPAVSGVPAASPASATSAASPSSGASSSSAEGAR